MQKGEIFGSYSEYAECAPMAGWCIKELTNLSVGAYPVPTGVLSEKAKWINDNDMDLAVEFHLNGFHQFAQGTEVLYHPLCDNGRKYAVLLSGMLSSELQTKNRGARARSNLLLLNRAKCPTIIVEPFFLQWEYKLLANPEVWEIIGTTTAKAIDHIRRNNL